VSGRTARRRVMRITLPDHAARPATVAARADMLAAEEPLGIRVDSTALTMTAPPQDMRMACRKT
jgi:formate dehydrogenase assembly factor FdhD